MHYFEGIGPQLEQLDRAGGQGRTVLIVETGCLGRLIKVIRKIATGIAPEKSGGVFPQSNKCGSPCQSATVSDNMADVPSPVNLHTGVLQLFLIYYDMSMCMDALHA